MSTRGSILSFSSADSNGTLDSLATMPSGGGVIDAADTLSALVRIICRSGMDPVTQLTGYLMTDDPTYLPESNHARLLADRVGRDKLLETLIEVYLKENGLPTSSAEPSA